MVRTIPDWWENGGYRVDIMKKTKEKVSNIGKILGKIKRLRTPWRGYAGIPHPIPPGYPQLIHTKDRLIHSLYTACPHVILPYIYILLP